MGLEWKILKVVVENLGTRGFVSIATTWYVVR